MKNSAMRVRLALPALQCLLGELEEAAAILELRQLVDQRQVLGTAAQMLLALAALDVGAVLVDRDLDRAAQVGFLERLDEIAERTGRDRALQGLGIAVTREEDHRHGRVLLDRARRLDAVHIAAQADVHDHELRVQLARHLDRFGAFARDPADAVAQPRQRIFEVARDQTLVLDQQDRDRVAGRGSAVGDREQRLMLLVDQTGLHTWAGRGGNARAVARVRSAHPWPHG